MKSFKLQFYDAFLSRPTPSPVISWIEPDGKTKWLPLNFGYHDVMCTGHIRHLGLWGTYPEKKFILRWPKPHFFLKIGIFYTKSSKLQSVQVNHLKLTNLRPWTQKTEASVGKHYACADTTSHVRQHRSESKPGKTNTALLSNYRGITLTCILSKVLERIVYDQITTYLQERNIRNESRYGFRKEHSCVGWSLNCCNWWLAFVK